MKFEDMTKDQQERTVNIYLLACAKSMQNENFSGYDRFMAKQLEQLIRDKINES